MANPTLRVRYQTIEIDGLDIHLRTLRDTQQYEDTDNVAQDLGISSAMWPIFGIVWDSSVVLAHLMAEHDINDRRVLEVGCGMALASHVLSHNDEDITATDYHPEAGGFLKINSRLNGEKTIPFVRTGWGDEDDTALGRFDLIIGSDVLYEVEQIILLADFIEAHAMPSCEVILVDPGRKHRGRFSKMMVARGYVESRTSPKAAYLAKPFKGEILSYIRSASEGNDAPSGS